MSKEIHFYVDNQSISTSVLANTAATHSNFQEALNIELEIIHTTSIVDLSFDLIDKGYRIFLHENKKTLELFDGMEVPGTGKQLRKGHNLIKLWKGGVFWGYFYDDMESKITNFNIIKSEEWKD